MIEEKIGILKKDKNDESYHFVCPYCKYYNTPDIQGIDKWYNENMPFDTQITKNMWSKLLKGDMVKIECDNWECNAPNQRIYIKLEK